MFKSNLSPLNPSKDKYNINNYNPQNNNYNPSNNDYQQTQGYHQSNYQFNKAMYSNNNNTNYQRQDTNNVSSNYNAPLSPLSPNVSKNPMSPTAKIKMFSNTLTLNKKNSSNTNNLLYQTNNNNTQENQKQNKAFSKIGVKNLVLDLTESLDLKCDQVLDDSDFIKGVNYRKQTPQTCNINNNRQQQVKYQKRVVSKIPILNFQSQVDDLICDEVLDMKSQLKEQNKINMKFKTNNNNTQIITNNINNNNIENNFTYTNVMINNNSKIKCNDNTADNNNRFINLNNQGTNAPNYQKNQGPLTPNYQKKKQNNIMLIRKNTDRDYPQNNSSNNSLHNIQPTHQKTRSFTNILSPHPNSNKSQLNNQEESQKSHSNQSCTQTYDVSNQQKAFEQMQKYLQKTSSLLQAYRKKLQDMEEKNTFLERENVQLRKCLYEDNSNKAPQVNQHHNMTSAGRYQGIK